MLGCVPQVVSVGEGDCVGSAHTRCLRGCLEELGWQMVPVVSPVVGLFPANIPQHVVHPENPPVANADNK
jgi:hypothetical protein